MLITKNCGFNPQHLKNKMKILKKKKTLYKVISVQETGTGRYWQALTGTGMWMSGNIAWSSQKESFEQNKNRENLRCLALCVSGDLK